MKTASKKKKSMKSIRALMSVLREMRASGAWRRSPDCLALASFYWKPDVVRIQHVVHGFTLCPIEAAYHHLTGKHLHWIDAASELGMPERTALKVVRASDLCPSGKLVKEDVRKLNQQLKEAIA